MHVYTAGVYLSLRGTIIANNSHVDIDNIGTTSNDTDALLCHTDGVDGDWYHNNTNITSSVNNMSAFISNKNQTVVKLFRKTSDTTTIGGQFYCRTNGTLIINIRKL